MTQISPAHVVPPKTTRLSIKRYIAGYLLSLSCTGLAYGIVHNHMNARATIIATVAALALAQCMVQLLFFLHVGQETKPRWKAAALYFTILIIGILVLGSLWIMNNLNYRMTPQQMDTYMKEQDGGI